MSVKLFRRQNPALSRFSYSGRQSSANLKARIPIVMSVVVVFAMLVAVPAVSANTAKKKLTQLQQGKAFYKGQVIDFQTTSSPGGGGDLAARGYATWIAKYLGATYYVNDATNSIEAQNEIAAANPNGLQIGEITTGGDVSSWLTTNHGGLNFNPIHFGFIVSTDPNPFVLAALTSSPYTSMTRLDTLTSGSSNATIPNVATTNSGAGPTELNMMFALLHLHLHVLASYSSAANEATGFQRGDTPLALLGLEQAGPLIEAGLARPLAIASQHLPVGTNFRDIMNGVPTFAQILSKYPPKGKYFKTVEKDFSDFVTMSGFTLVLQPGVSNDKLVALRAAARWASQQSGFKSTMTAQGSNDTYLSPVTAKDRYVGLINDSSYLSCYVNNVTCAQ